MTHLLLAAVLAALPRPLPPEPGCSRGDTSVPRSIPRGTVPRDVSPDPRPPVSP